MRYSYCRIVVKNKKTKKNALFVLSYCRIVVLSKKNKKNKKKCPYNSYYHKKDCVGMTKYKFQKV